MEEAIISKSGKGWLLNFTNNKRMTVNWPTLPQNASGKVMVKRVNGHPVEIVIGDQKYFKPSFPPPPAREVAGSRFRSNPTDPRNSRREQQRGQDRGFSQNIPREPSIAPFNFIPLNESIVASPNKTDHSCFEGFSGYIELQVDAVTPLFIRGSDGNFFRVNEVPYIPGSTVRGLSHSLIEVVTRSAFNLFDDRFLYRRTNPTTEKNLQIFKGFLKIDNEEYVLIPAEGRLIEKKAKRKQHQYRYGENGCEFTTGLFIDNTSVWKFEVAGNRTEQKGLSKVLDSYQFDATRSENVIDILKSLERNKIVDKTGKSIPGNDNVGTWIKKLGIPVFYTKNEEGEIASIGHVKYHRMPYNYSVGAHIHQKKVDSSTTDFSETIFGSTQKSGNVFFEDLKISTSIQQELPEATVPRILSSPKPTSFQHYLIQPSIHTPRTKLQTWNSQKVQIRGWKLYWHRNTSSRSDHRHTWIEPGAPTSSHSSPINPLSPGTKFSGRIRFQNLTVEELGALLFVLDLPEGCCHKLGMGKPLGLGSVKITPRLILIDRNSRYNQLFDVQGNWYTGEKTDKDIQHYKDAFAQYMGKATKDPQVVDAISYWELDPRVKELKVMLTYKHDITPEELFNKTSYLPHQKFEERPVLPLKPTDVIKGS